MPSGLFYGYAPGLSSPQSRMNPNLNFAQSIPVKMAGSPNGIIETVALIQVVDGLEYPDWGYQKTQF